jgi:hypothetical protein
MAKFPPDRFDGVADSLQRVGAHRSGVTRHTGWIAFAWAALATGVLVAVGIGVLNFSNSGNSFTDPKPVASASNTPKPSSTPSKTPTPSAPATTPSTTPTPSVTPLLDPSQIDSSVTKIAVLNSTTTKGLAANAATRLRTGGWTVAAQGNAATPAAASVVYYSSSATNNESIALGIAQTLGIASVQPSTAFPNATITVVLGSNYVAK